jgi:predicted RNase H-like HicB family nuclease
MRTFNFQIVIEPDEDAWTAYCPALIEQGASTWGSTREEAIKHINEVVRMVVESLLEHGEPIPADVVDHSSESETAQLAITL